ncbi:response regulator [Sphingomonas sp. DT-204]|uniref:response regulator n=1 Tax=Sphingomonas sp. DT-204 TaxID=3396166 RepID=UPI003F540F07
MDDGDGQRCVALIVEDEWLIRMELADALTSAGVDVFEASAGEDALAYLDGGRPIHILITDIRLVGALTGWEVAEAFRSARPGIGVIYASANPPQEARQVPGSVFFAKPAPTRQIVQACYRLCAVARPPSGSD